MDNKLGLIRKAITKLNNFYKIKKYLAKEGVTVTKELLLTRMRNMQNGR